MDKVTVKRDSAPFINRKSSKLSPLSTNIKKPLQKRGLHQAGMDSLIFQMPSALPRRLTELAPAAIVTVVAEASSGRSLHLSRCVQWVKTPLDLEVYHRILTLPTARGRAGILKISGFRYTQKSLRCG